MASTDKIEMEGTIVKVLKGAKFQVELNDNHHLVECSVGGRLRMNKIKILQGDMVTVAISPYDLSRGIIIWRSR